MPRPPAAPRVQTWHCILGPAHHRPHHQGRRWRLPGCESDSKSESGQTPARPGIVCQLKRVPGPISVSFLPARCLAYPWKIVFSTAASGFMSPLGVASHPNAHLPGPSSQWPVWPFSGCQSRYDLIHFYWVHVSRRVMSWRLSWKVDPASGVAHTEKQGRLIIRDT